jgi:glycerol-3-phosphate acyltransferase PlsX
LAAHEPAFIGNIEGRHLFDGKADVLVMDGFVGNVVLKIMEGIAGFLATSVRGAIEGNSLAKLGALLMKPTMKEYGRRFNYAEYGGAPLLGCNGVIIICHGGSSEVAITNAIKVAEKGVRDRIPERIREEIEREANELQDQESQGGATAEGVES